MTYRKEVVRGVLIAMPKRDRGFGFWVVTALFIAALLSLILALTYDVATSHTERKLRAEQNSSGYAFSAEKRMKEACGGLSGGDLIACVQKEVEATNEHKRSEHDLTAQEDMDDWSFWLLWVSVSSVAVSTLAVILVWRTLDVTRDTLVATQEMAKDTRDIGEAQVRAYLSITPMRLIESDNGKVARAFIAVKNTGQSPALEVEIWFTLQCTGAKFEHVIGGIDEHDNVWRTFSIASGETVYIKAETNIGAEGATYPFFMACPRYADVFRKEVNTGPQVSFRFQGGEWVHPRIIPKKRDD